MAKALNVYLHRQLVGKLIQDDDGQMVFDYDQDWLNNPGAIAISQSLPLQEQRFTRKECRGFFAGILPEEEQRVLIAKNLGVSKANDFKLLEQIGGECAGAITFIPADEDLPADDYRYRTLSECELFNILEKLPFKPLMAGEDDVRLSLAGAQDKIAVYVHENNISIPLGGAPSTHIIKPAIKRFEGLVFNEAFCMKLAKLVNLQVADVQIKQAKNIHYLLVERYDRRSNKNGNILRIHQEDFCQALGIASEMKYQNEGGPRLQDCFNILRQSSTRPALDLVWLLEAVIFNWLIGNHDAHGKNFSLLYVEKNRERYDTNVPVGNSKNRDIGVQASAGTYFAPLYDLVSTVYYPELSKKMAMKIGEEYASHKVMPKDFNQLAQEAGLSKPALHKRIIELAIKTQEKLPLVDVDHSVADHLRERINVRCEWVLDRFKA